MGINASTLEHSAVSPAALRVLYCALSLPGPDTAVRGAFVPSLIKKRRKRMRKKKHRKMLKATRWKRRQLKK